MNLLADENFPLFSARLLEQKGHKIRSVALLFRGIPDTKVLSEAIENEECIITFDKDFGELIFKYNFPHPPAIILFRMDNFLPDEPAKILINIIEEEKILLPGYLTVITQNKTRQKKLPGIK
jgi:predicted nuclease of predicted toxin-antitoxin system